MRNKNIDKIKPKIIKILKERGIKKASIFGSYARGEEKKDSDIDIIIEVKGKKISLFDLVNLEIRLMNVLNKKVDLVTYGGLNNYLKEIIKKEEIRIL